MLDWRMFLGAIVGPIDGTRGPVKTEFFWASRQRNQCNCRSVDLILQAIMVSLTTPVAVELSVCIAEGGWGQPISIRVWCIGTIYLAVMKRAQSLASAADEMTNFMIWVMVKMGPLHRGTGSYSAGKMCSPYRLRPLDSLCNPESECAARNTLVAL